MFELVLRIGLSLFVVLGMMWGLARLVRRPLTGRGHGALVVLNRQQLSRGAAVTVVKVADRVMVLGVTDQQVSLLGEADVADFEKPPPEQRDHVDLEGDELPGAHPAGGGRRRFDHSLLDFLRDRTTRQ